MNPSVETRTPVADVRPLPPPRRDSRWLDIGVSLALIVLAAPLWLVISALLACRAVRWSRVARVGRGGQPFGEFKLVTGPRWKALRRLPALFNVLWGQMAMVGPRAISPGDPLLRQPEAAWRFGVRPGLVCLWWLRQRANIDYGSELDVDYEYVATRGPRRDLGILVRAGLAFPFRRRRAAFQPQLSVLGMRMDNLTMADAVAEIVRRAEAEAPSQVCFLNADCMNIACRDADYRGVVQSAPLVLADGIGLKLAGRILRREIRQNVNGTDLFPRLCDALSGGERGIYLLGSRPGVAEAVAGWIAANYPGVRVRGWRHGYFTSAEEPDVLRGIANSGAAVLLVAFGAPRQDLWIARNLAATGVKVAMGVGGLFDFYSGRIPRAPQWMRELCLEWLYRVYQEPGRLWKRYFLGNGLFLARVLRERMLGPPLWNAELPTPPPATKPDDVTAMNA